MIYFKEGGWFLPDGEEHLQEWMLKVNRRERGRLAYQFHKYEAAMNLIPTDRRHVAVDIGAHVGLWSYYMAHDFDALYAFEPMSAHRDCWCSNVSQHLTGKELHLIGVALGEKPGTAKMLCRTPGSSGDTGVDPKAETSSLRVSVGENGEVVPMLPLDHFKIENVNFIKIDCEGYELFVLHGAVETLKRCKPVVIVEQKPETGMEERYGIGTTDAVKFLESLGAKKRAGIQGDYILSWD